MAAPLLAGFGLWSLPLLLAVESGAPGLYFASSGLCPQFTCLDPGGTGDRALASRALHLAWPLLRSLLTFRSLLGEGVWGGGGISLSSRLAFRALHPQDAG